MTTNLHTRIQNKSAKVAIIGLGYVGLPVACIFAETGFDVLGVDIDPARIEKINAGQSPIEGDEPGLAELLATVVAAGKLRATTDYAALADVDIVLVAVDTPVDDNNHPQYVALKGAMTDLGRVITPGTLVVVESTIAPGTIDTVVRPILEAQSGLKANRDFYIGACPERVMPGKLLANLRRMSRVCGGGTPETAQLMVEFYRNVVQAELDTADIITAELVKTTENAYRDVQIAFANEVAKICEINGADVWKVRALVNKSPGRNMHQPGAGVGGHCIPKDPWLLAYSARDRIPLHLIPAARAVNESMPGHVAEMTLRALGGADVAVSQAKIAVLGYAYLENSDDTRHSPTVALMAHLQNKVAELRIHDPWVEPYRTDLWETISGCDAVVLMVKHDAYRDLDFARLKTLLRTPILVDGRGFFAPQDVASAELRYFGVGRGG